MSAHRGHVAITGGAGFIGTNLAARLVGDGREVVIIDDLSRRGVQRNAEWLTNTFGDLIEVHRVDVCDRSAIRPLLAGADAVFHLAAQVAVTTSLDDPLRDFETNLAGTLCVLEEIRRLQRPPFLLFTSTNKVYGTLDDVELACRDRRWEPVDPEIRKNGLSEERRLDFRTPYGCSKGGADQYVLDYANSFDIPAVVFRMSCVYGPHQQGNEDQGWVAHFASQVVCAEPIMFYGDGCQVRDILFVDDLVDAMLAATGESSALSGRAFNIGGGASNAVSLWEVVEQLASLSGTSPAPTLNEEREGDQRYYVSDARRFREACDWSPTIDVSLGMRRLYEWLLQERSPHSKK